MVGRGQYNPRRAFSLIELMVVIGIMAASVAILIPAVGKAQESFKLSRDRNNAGFVTKATLSYAAEHRQRFVPDYREPALASTMGGAAKYDWTLVAPQTYEKRELSWFGQLEAGYLGGNLDMVDCPVVDDHRKIGASIAYRPPWVWPADYVINAMALNASSDLADEPSQNVLIAEPNMPRGAVAVIAHVYCFTDWGTADRLEQTIAGALSFGFVDGHADRVHVPPMKGAYGAAFPGLALSAGNPPANPSQVYGNAFYLSRSQLNDRGLPVMPAPNSLKRPIKVP